MAKNSFVVEVTFTIPLTVGKVQMEPFFGPGIDSISPSLRRNAWKNRL